MLRRIFLRFAVAASGILLAACASTGTNAPRGSSTTVLTQEEIAQTNVTNLYDAVERLRPRWLQVRGSSMMSGSNVAIVVYLNRSYLGAPDVLKGYDTKAALRLRYMDGPTASSTLTGLPAGTFIGGAIVLETNQGGR